MQEAVHCWTVLLVLKWYHLLFRRSKNHSFHSKIICSSNWIVIIDPQTYCYSLWIQRSMNTSSGVTALATFLLSWNEEILHPLKNLTLKWKCPVLYTLSVLKASLYELHKTKKLDILLSPHYSPNILK